MRSRIRETTALCVLMGAWLLTASGHAQDKQPPTVKIPNAGVPQIMTIEGNFVRAAYNNEGYVILGYQVTNRSVGEDWIMLDVGMTVLEKVPDYTLKRDALSLDPPDGTTIPLASITDYRQDESKLQALQNRAKVQSDSINYFPPSAHRACRIGFFADLSSRAVAYDEVELSSQRGCVGRLYFHIPGGIAYGQYFLNVKFAQSVVRVPFKVFTKDEEKLLSKNYGSIKKQVDAAFKPKKKS
jgi:hypothetical protein